jgi:hypothetical protein
MPTFRVGKRVRKSRHSQNVGADQHFGTCQIARMNERANLFLYGRPLHEDLGMFGEEGFENAGRRLTPEAVDVLLGLGQVHPY